MAAVAGLEQRRREFVEERIAILQDTISMGRTAYLVEVICLAGLSMIDGEKIAGRLDVDSVRKAAYQGWQIASVVPLTGATGDTVGLHLFLSYPVTQANFEASRKVLDTYFALEAQRLVT